MHEEKEASLEDMKMVGFQPRGAFAFFISMMLFFAIIWLSFYFTMVARK